MNSSMRKMLFFQVRTTLAFPRKEQMQFAHNKAEIFKFK